MTSSFRLHLTNVNDVYTDNSPSYFQTYFDNPIELQGSWKVALEEISYSSHIKTQQASIDFNVIPADEKALWTNHPFHYRLSEDECWLGCDGIEPDFEYPLESYSLGTIEDVIPKLNAMNQLILHDGNKRKVFGDVFKFFLENDRVVYQCFDAHFTYKKLSCALLRF